MQSNGPSPTEPIAPAAVSAAPVSAVFPLVYEPLGNRTYHIGTLHYTIGGLVILFAWLLMADFAFSLMELVIPKVLPLTLNEVGASNATIGLLVGTISSAASLLLNPIISFHSDRHRSRWGRRRPYLIWSAPFIALFLILTGYSTNIGSWLHDALAGRFGNVSRNTVILATVGVLCVAFQFFNMFVRSVYYYLLNDVVPQVTIGRFYALFRVVDAGAGFMFNTYLLRYADNPATRKWIYISMGILYFVAFILMCWNVKEGEYPEPTPLGGGTQFERLVSGIKTYARECFSIRLYWWLFLANACYRAAEISIFNFQLLLSKDLGMTLDHVGKVLGQVALLGVFLYYPLGWLSDKIHAIRLVLLSAVVTFGILSASIWMVRTPSSFTVLTFMWSIAWLAYISGIVPLTLYIFPRDRFGQISSANGIMNAASIMIASYGGGFFIDKFGQRLLISQGVSQYIAVYWSGAMWSGLALVFFVLFYCEWKRLGGRESYIPPEPAAPAHGFSVATTNS